MSLEKFPAGDGPKQEGVNGKKEKTIREMNIELKAKHILSELPFVSTEYRKELDQRMEDLGEIIASEHGVSVEDIETLQGDTKLGPRSAEKVQETIQWAESNKNGLLTREV